jgi:hypothetical protein
MSGPWLVSVMERMWRHDVYPHLLVLLHLQVLGLD